MKKILTILGLILASGNAFATQCNVSEARVAFVPEDGSYQASYTHFIPQVPNACPAEFTQNNPLVLQYTVNNGFLMWTSVLAPTGIKLEKNVPFCDEGIKHSTIYMSTEIGHITLPRDGTVSQISVEFKKNLPATTLVIGNSMGYLGEDKNCLFMNESAYQKYYTDNPALARANMKQ